MPRSLHAPPGPFACLPAELAGLPPVLGVTRIGRVTGLDRSGVEVACAVRPRGHVLQVCNGKGEQLEDAAAGALLEAAELWAAERIDPLELVWGSLEELRGAEAGLGPKRETREPRVRAWGADAMGSAGRLVAPELWSERTRCAWREGLELFSGGPVLVPAQAVHCPPPGAPALGPAVVAWTSNGMGAHPDPHAALLHALLEAAERDQLARALPHGWTRAAIGDRLLDAADLRHAAPGAFALAEAIGARGFDVYLFDLRPAPEEGDLGLPVAGALLFDRQRGPIPATAGYACALSLDAALRSALLEAAQSRLTDIHGAREDVAHCDLHPLDRLRRVCGAAKPSRRLPRSGHSGRSARRGTRATRPTDAVRDVLERFAAAGFQQVAHLELAPASLRPTLHVAKVVVPGFLVSELL